MRARYPSAGWAYPDAARRIIPFPKIPSGLDVCDSDDTRNRIQFIQCTQAISGVGLDGSITPDAETHLLDAGHFALETNVPEMARLIRDFLGQTIAVEKAAK